MNDHYKIAREVAIKLYGTVHSSTIYVSNINRNIFFDALVYLDKEIVCIEVESLSSDLKHIRSHIIDAMILCDERDQLVTLLFVATDSEYKRVKETVYKAEREIRTIARHELQNKLRIRTMSLAHLDGHKKLYSRSHAS